MARRRNRLIITIETRQSNHMRGVELEGAAPCDDTSNEQRPIVPKLMQAGVNARAAAILACGIGNRGGVAGSARGSGMTTHVCMSLSYICYISLTPYLGSLYCIGHASTHASRVSRNG